MTLAPPVPDATPGILTGSPLAGTAPAAPDPAPGGEPATDADPRPGPAPAPSAPASAALASPTTPAPRSTTRRTSGPARLAPGLLAVGAATVACLVAGRAAPALSPLLLAVAVGAVARGAGLLPAAVRPGLAWSARHLLRAGVVLLGLQLSVTAVLALRPGEVAVVVSTVAVTFVATRWAGARLGVDRRTALLVATGFSICGAAAVAAMSAALPAARRPGQTGRGAAGDAPAQHHTAGPTSAGGATGPAGTRATGTGPSGTGPSGTSVTGTSLMDTSLTGTSARGTGAADAAAADTAAADAGDPAVGTAVALVTVFGSLALVAMPLAQAPLGLDDRQVGVWIGASVHEVAQVVAAASGVSAAALAVAVVVKLARVVLLAPLVAVVGAVERHRERAASAHRTGTARPGHARPSHPHPGNAHSAEAHLGPASAARPPLVPLFVLGFLAAVAVRSTGVVPEVALDGARVAGTALLTAAMLGLGADVHVPTLVRTGGRALALGAVSTLVTASTSLAGLYLLA